jgi:MmyB-like transcription regulator ligand binding domain
MRPFIEDWEEVATGLLQRVRREALGHVIDATTVNLLNDLRKYPRNQSAELGSNGTGSGSADHLRERA